MAYRYEESISFHPLIKLLYVAMIGVFAWVQFQEDPGPLGLQRRWAAS